MNTRSPIEGQLAEAPESASVKQTAMVAHQDRPPSSNPFDAAPAQFAVQIRERGENYASLVAWLCTHMVLGEDLVQVHIVKKDKCDPRNCDCSPTTNPWHWSDPTLSKKGAEKVCGLLGIGVRFLGMEDFRRMALKGVAIRDIIIDCELYNGREETISQGTGACNVDETQGNLNNALKKACKRAHVDAVLRVAGLSGIATEIKRRMPAIDLERAQQGQPQRQATAATDDRAEASRGGHNTGAKLTHCPLAKHKGKPWREVPSDYLEWIVRTLTDKPDLLRAAAGELEKRRSDAPAGSDSTHTQRPPSSPERGAAPGRSPLPADKYPFDDEVPF